MSDPLAAYNQRYQTDAEKFKALKPGATVRVHQKIQEGEKSRIQIFEGLIIARKHGSGPSATITVRKVSNGVGVERVFPIHLPTIAQFEVTKTARVRRAKLYYIREKTARETRRKTKVIDPKAHPTQITSEVAPQ